MTTTGNCASGSTIAVLASVINSSRDISSVGDGANTYALGTKWIDSNNSTATNVAVSGALGSTLSSGATVTVTFTGVALSAAKHAAVACIAGATGTPAFDIMGTSNNNGSSANKFPIYPASGLTPSLASANEVAFGTLTWLGIGGTVSVEGSGFTSMGVLTRGSISQSWAYQVVGSTTGLSYAPTMSANEDWSANIVTINFASGAHHRLIDN